MTAASNSAVSEVTVPDSAVAERAYGIWEQEGRPEGREMEHWLRAEAEMRAVALAGAAMRPARRAEAKPAADRLDKAALRTAAE